MGQGWIIASFITPFGYLAVSRFRRRQAGGNITFWHLLAGLSVPHSVGKSTADGGHRVRLVDVDWTNVLLCTLIALLLCSIARLF